MDWLAFLGTQGAQQDEAQAVHFPNDSAQHQAFDSGVTITPLTHLGLIKLQGEETVPFLQGQLSSDVKKLSSPGWQFSSYSTPKGRMLASFIVLRDGDEALLQLPTPLQPAIQKRLTMFIMRSKTKATDANAELVALGLAGPKAAGLVSSLLGADALDADKTAARITGGWAIRLPGERFQLIVDAATAQALWAQCLARGAVPAATRVWTLGDIRAGTPWVLPATQEEFVPQMANMELIGAVSFQKGCYPGQEIVARTQYLGKLKRRTFRVRASAPMAAGEPVFSPEMNGQASGMVAMATPLADGSWEALVVVQMSSVEHGLHLQAPDGPTLECLTLPYPVVEEAQA